MTNKSRLNSRWYTVNYKNQTYRAKRIYAGSTTEAFNIFVAMYGHEAPSTERADYTIL